MKLSKLSYKIVVSGFWGREIKTVRGFAVDTVARICVHLDDGEWECTDYDTGYKIGLLFRSKDACLKNADEILKRNIPTGRYAKAQKAALQKLKDAGLLK